MVRVFISGAICLALSTSVVALVLDDAERWRIALAGFAAGAWFINGFNDLLWWSYRR